MQLAAVCVLSGPQYVWNASGVRLIFILVSVLCHNAKHFGAMRCTEQS